MINRLIKEIEESMKQGNKLVALMAALSLPDICGKAEYGNIGTTSRYKKWYSEHIGKYEIDPLWPDMPCPSADIIYNLRCSLTHEAIPGINMGKNNLTDFKLISTGRPVDGGSSGMCNEKHTRELEINIDNLIWKLCLVTGKYYEKNKDKFGFLNKINIEF